MSDDVRLYPQAALGYRVFAICPQGHLHSTFAQSHWTPGVNVACCDYRRHRQPPALGSGCHCGFNAFHDADMAVAYRHQRRRGSELSVLAAVAGRGKLAVHADGWRAAEAQILGLCAEGTSSRERHTLARVASAYGVPLFDTVADLEVFAERHAGAVPESERPDVGAPEAESLSLRRRLRNAAAWLLISALIAIWVAALPMIITVGLRPLGVEISSIDAAAAAFWPLFAIVTAAIFILPYLLMGRPRKRRRRRQAGKA